jgi:hypothetical protein
MVRQDYDRVDREWALLSCCTERSAQSVNMLNEHIGTAIGERLP